MLKRTSRIVAAVAIGLALVGCGSSSGGSSGSSGGSSASTSVNPADIGPAAVALGENWKAAVADAKGQPSDMQGFTSDYAVMQSSFTALSMADLTAMCPAIRGGTPTYAQYKQGAGAAALPEANYDQLVTAICAASEPPEMTYVWKTVG